MEFNATSSDMFNPLQMKYKGIIIQDLWLEKSHWNDSEVELTVKTDNCILKNNYLPYIPAKHDSILYLNGSLEKKMEILWEDVLSVIDALIDAE